jgi:hypothetical protein
MGRYPELSRESGTAAAGTTMQIELTNNLFWDQRRYIDINPTVLSGDDGAAAIYYQLNWVGNSSFVRSGYRFGMLFFPNPTGRSTRRSCRQPHEPLPRPRGLGAGVLLQRLPARPRARPRPAYARTARHPFPTGERHARRTWCAPTRRQRRRLPPRPDGHAAHELRERGTLDARAPTATPRATRCARPSPGAPAAPRTPTATACPTTGSAPTASTPRVQDHNGTQLSVAKMGRAGYTNLECYLLRALERVAGR